MSGAAEFASASIRTNLDVLVAGALERQWARWPGMNDSFSAEQLAKTAEDTRYHLEYIASSLWFEEQALLDDYAVWCKVLFANLNMPAEWFTGSLECIAETLDAVMPRDEAAVARAYIENSLEAFRTASTETTSFIVPGSPLGVLARSYLSASIDGNRGDAVLMLDHAVDAGTPVREIYLEVFQPVQREVGRLWQLHQVSVAQEHWVTAVTQVAMARISDRLIPTHELDKTVITACVGKEQHDLGARMVSDFFEMEGWDARFLGANTPSDAVVGAVRECEADVLALSATMTSHVKGVADIITLLRADTELAETQVIVGGYPFNIAPDLWEHVGADGYAADAETAPAVAAALTGA
jgi:methanogenic corrinoid protein MtbC1